MSKDILHTIRYFSRFQYPPSLRELYAFHPRPVSYSQLQRETDSLVEKGIVVRKKVGRKNKYYFRYTLEGYMDFFTIWKERYDNSNRKLQKKNTYVTILSRFPYIHLIGLSGSLSMKNAEESADIDLFIITAPNRLWLGRLTALALAFLLRVRRRRGVVHASDKICLNLFFDGSDIRLPTYKRSEYTAHEVLQMIPLYSNTDTYDRFMKANSWVFSLFPNARKHMVKQIVTPYAHSWIGTGAEWVCKHIQQRIIHRHRTTEIITPTQLWFFPDDYEKKIIETI